MKAWFDWIMQRRARRLTQRLDAWIPLGSRVADVGSGTGHNGQHWRTERRAVVIEYDVADMHWVGEGPILFNGVTIPLADDTYPLVTALFVLQYSTQPVQLLRELGRISSGRVILLQSTYQGGWGWMWLKLRDIVWGPLAFLMARAAGLVRGSSWPLISQTLYSRPALQQIIQQAELRICHWEPEAWWGGGLLVSRDLYVLERTSVPAISPSLYPPATKNVG